MSAIPPALAPPLPGTVQVMTDSSGSPYGVARQHALGQAGRTVQLTSGESGAQVPREEMNINVSSKDFDVSVSRDVEPQRVVYHSLKDVSDGIARGMRPLASIAYGITRSRITRAAEVHRKERRTLIVVPREPPLGQIHLENMPGVSRAGALVLPAMPGWHPRPKSLDGLVKFVVARSCDQLGVDRPARHWGESPSPATGTRGAS
ncbi:flavoprotein [Singulisphaera sp. Ch08]|uniref:Flavoprotein n=1 Tax=Singulisphaera sp. Ch08 TaxID=3120278 RepID=A0AAU7CF76_9BACT